MNVFKGPALRVLISISSLGLIAFFLRDKLGEAFRILAHDVAWNWFLISLAGYIAVQVIMAYRLYRIFLIQKLTISYPETLYLCTVGLFFNLFLPSAVGGDVAKIYYAAKYSGRKIEATTAIIVDRLMGFIAIMLIASIAMVTVGQGIIEERIRYVVFGFIGLMVLTVGMFASRRLSAPVRNLRVLLPSDKLRAKAAELYHAIYSCKKSWRALFFCVLLSLTGQSVFIMMYQWLAAGLGAHVHLSIFFMIIPLVTIISMAPSLGGLGVREAGAIYFLSQYMSQERALALCLLMNMLIYGFGLAAGLIYALGGGLKASSFRQIEKSAS